MGKNYNKLLSDEIQMSLLFSVIELLGLVCMVTASVGRFYYLINIC